MQSPSSSVQIDIRLPQYLPLPRELHVKVFNFVNFELGMLGKPFVMFELTRIPKDFKGYGFENLLKVVSITVNIAMYTDYFK